MNWSDEAELILQPFRRFTYVTAHSPTLPSLYLRHSSFSNPSVASATSRLILQPFRCFTYVTVHSPTLLSLLIRHRLFTWRAAHGISITRIRTHYVRGRKWTEGGYAAFPIALFNILRIRCSTIIQYTL